MPNVPTTCAQYAYCLISIIRNLVEEKLMMGSQDIDAFQRCKIHNQIKVHQRLNVVVVVYKNNSYHFLHHFHTGTLIIFSCAQFSEKMHLRTHIYTYQYYRDTYNLNFTHSKYVDLLQHAGQYCSTEGEARVLQYCPKCCNKSKYFE